MGSFFVTTVARRDNVFVPGRMADMTVLAGEFIAVGLAISLQGRYDCRVAFDTILGREKFCWRRFVGWRGNGFVGGEAELL